MNITKQEAIKYNEQDFRFIGYWDERYNYQKKIEEKKVKINETTYKIIPRQWQLIQIDEENLLKGSLPYFIKKGLTKPATNKD